MGKEKINRGRSIFMVNFSGADGQRPTVIKSVALALCDDNFVLQYGTQITTGEGDNHIFGLQPIIGTLETSPGKHWLCFCMQLKGQPRLPDSVFNGREETYHAPANQIHF